VNKRAFITLLGGAAARGARAAGGDAARGLAGVGRMLVQHGRRLRSLRWTIVPLAYNSQRSHAQPSRPVALAIPKTDGTYIVEFRMAGGEALAISIPGRRDAEL
jgi:hypothetical protein